MDYQDTEILFLTGRHIISALHMVELTKMFERRDRLLIGTLKEAVAVGAYPPMNIRLVALAIVGMCNSVAIWYSPSGPSTYDEIAEVLFDLVHRGLVKKG